MNMKFRAALRTAGTLLFTATGLQVQNENVWGQNPETVVHDTARSLNQYF